MDTKWTPGECPSCASHGGKNVPMELNGLRFVCAKPMGDTVTIHVDDLPMGRAYLNTPEMYRILKSLEVENCYLCDGTGTEPNNDQDACHICGGYGKTISAPWPGDVEAVLRNIEVS